MNQRDQSPLIHLAWRVPQVDITHSSSKLSVLSVCLAQYLHAILRAFVFFCRVCVRVLWCVQLPIVSAGDQCSAASTEAISDDALFRDKLKHMGKCECPASATFTDVLLTRTAFFFWCSPCLLCFFAFYPSATRKKLFEIARTFSEKTKRRKSKRKVLLKHHSYPRHLPESCSRQSVFAQCWCVFLPEQRSFSGWAQPSLRPTSWMTLRGTPVVRPPFVPFSIRRLLKCAVATDVCLFVSAEEDGQPRRANTQGAKEQGGEPVSWWEADLRSCDSDL